MALKTKKARKPVRGSESTGHGQELYDQALKILETSNFRLTKPRQVLLKTIFQQKGPFSVPQLEKILSGPSRKNPIDPVTIYRTLPVFEELHLIEKCDFSDEMAHYEVVLHHDDDHHHHHILCTNCKAVEPLDFCILESQEQLLKKLGYTGLNHRLEFTGLCPNCSR